MDLRNPLRQTAVLFDGQADGQWTLPEELLEARDTIVRLDSLGAELSRQSPESLHDVRDRLAYLVATGAELDTAPVFDARRAIDEHAERVTLLGKAREIANSRLTTMLSDRAGELIRDHLAPAFDTLADKLRRDFDTARHIDSQSPPAVVLSQPKAVRDALIRIDTNVARYRLIRQAGGLVHKLRQVPSQDSRGYFGEVHNTETVWPEITRVGGYAPSSPPWPTDDTRARLAWLFANGAKVWLPTVEQQDARYLEVFGERLERARANRSHLNAYRAMFGETA